MFHASKTFRKPSNIREILHTMVQLGWRQSNADKELYTPLFASAYLEETYLINHVETTSIWMKFNDDLFRTLDGFIGKEKTSYNSIKIQFEKRIAEFKHTFGGKTENAKIIVVKISRMLLDFLNVLEA